MHFLLVGSTSFSHACAHTRVIKTRKSFTYGSIFLYYFYIILDALYDAPNDVPSIIDALFMFIQETQ
nr:MAG TPA: hypothetical protein [Caudoviricetes sp.]